MIYSGVGKVGFTACLLNRSGCKPFVGSIPTAGAYEKEKRVAEL